MRKLEEMKTLEGEKIKLAISKAERILKKHNAETTKKIAELTASKGAVDIDYDATTGLPTIGYKRIGKCTKGKGMSVALEDKISAATIIIRENKYFGGDPSAAILALNRAIPTELIPES